MPFSIFRLRTLRGANIVGVLIGMSLFSMFFFISLYLQDVLGYSPIKTGFAYLPLAVGIIIAAGVASQLVTRVGFKTPLIAGILLVAAGLLWFSHAPATGGSFAADVLGPSLLAGVGFGLAFVPVTIAVVTGAEPHEAGLAPGLINTSQQVGGALGLAILATVANSRTQSLLHAGVHSSAVALTKGYDRAFLVGAALAVAAAILGAVLISSRDSTNTQRRPAPARPPAPSPQPFRPSRADRSSVKREPARRKRSSLSCHVAPRPRTTRLPMQNASPDPVPPSPAIQRFSSASWECRETRLSEPASCQAG
jgi:MFS family permease